MPDADAAWNDDLLRDPHHVADKRSRVQRMFSAIAPKYDLNNRVHSFGMDQRWRKKAVSLAELKANDRVIDVACGTGDLTLKFFASLWFERMGVEPLPKLGLNFAEAAQVTGIDFTFDMLPIANAKKNGWKGSRGWCDAANAATKSNVAWLNADATALPLADASANVVSIAFGIRNVQEPAKAVAEFFRVLKPGGRVIVLEFSQPKNRVIRFFNDLYCSKIMPTTATWLSGDTTGAYKYLPKSVESFVSRDQMSAMLRDAGFVDVTQHPMTFGVAVVYRGYKR
jgi:demethylmenaquinone methyltransferase / 2-methoxy-6-polyprenyl-1,4-benzoquinol methylase